MRYRFSDILREEIYNKCNTMFITGPYEIFNNMVAETARYSCMENGVQIETKVDMLDEFGISTTESSTSLSSVSFDQFFEVVQSPNINGRWYCYTDYAMLKEKQRKKFKEYIKKSNRNGLLVVESKEFMDFKDIIKNRTFDSSREVHHINMSFPDRNTVESIVAEAFLEKGRKLKPKALDSFVTRMNKGYDDLDRMVDLVVECTKEEEEVKEADIRLALKGVEHFGIEDFMEELVKPLSNDTTNNKKIYRIMAAMIDEYGASKLVEKLLREINTMIDFRIMINRGTIPIKINFFFSDIKKELGSDNKYSKMNEYTFRKKANMAAQTSLRDWEYMKLMLMRSKNSYSEVAKIRAIYDVVTRSQMSMSRLYNVIGIEDIIESSYRQLDNIRYE